MGKRPVGDCRPFFVGASDSIKGNALRAVAEALRAESVLLRYGDAPDQLLGQHTRRQPPERFFIGAASRRFAGCFIASRLGPQRHKAWPLAREYPLRMHIFSRIKMTSQLEGIFPRRTAAETADCGTPKKSARSVVVRLPVMSLMRSSCSLKVVLPLFLVFICTSSESIKIY